MKKVVWLMNEKNPTKTDYSIAINFWYGVLENLGYEVAYSMYEEYNVDNFYNQIKNFKPNFVIVPGYNLIHTEFIRLKEFTKVYVLQSDDSWRFDNFCKYWIPFVDGVISFDGNAEEKYKEFGLEPENYCKMRWAFNPNMMVNPPVEKELYISHTGGLHGNREQKILEFMSKGEKVDVFHPNTYAETKYIWAASKYSLGFTMNSVMTARHAKGRVAEIPNHTVLVTEPFPEIEEYYDIKKEIILFDTVDEAIEKIKYYNDNESEYNKLFEAGKRAIWSRNTAYHEWNKILHKIDPDYKSIDVINLLKEKHKDFYYE
jgi:hypothetical protein